MKNEQLELLIKVSKGELTPHEAQKELCKLFSDEGSFSIDDIRDVYNLGRSHERNNSNCTDKIIVDAWLRADVLFRKIKWV